MPESFVVHLPVTVMACKTNPSLRWEINPKRKDAAKQVTCPACQSHIVGLEVSP